MNMPLPHAGAVARDVACGDDRVVAASRADRAHRAPPAAARQRLAERPAGRAPRACSSLLLGGSVRDRRVAAHPPRNASTQGRQRRCAARIGRCSPRWIPTHERPAPRRAARPRLGPARAGRCSRCARRRRCGASQAEAAVSMDVGLSVSVRTGRSRDRRVPARPRHGCHRVLRHAQGRGEHRRPEPRTRCAKPSPRPAASRGSRPRIPARVSPIPTRSRPRSRISTCRTRGMSTPETACELARRLRGGRDGRRSSASRTPTAPASARIAACAPTATRTVSWPPTRASLHSISCAVLGVDGDEMERDYWYSTARDWRELEHAESASDVAAANAPCARLGARKLATTRAPVLYSPGRRARTDRAFHRRDSRRQPVPARIVPAGRGGCNRSFPTGSRSAERPHLREGARQRAVRPRRRRDARSRTRREAACSLGYVLSTYSARKLGLQHDGQRRRHAQPARAGPRARLRRACSR